MPDHSSSTPTDRVTSRPASPLVRWLRGSLPVPKGADRFATDDPANPYVHYREVKEALRRANLDFAAAVGASASSRVQERMARRVSSLQVKEDQAVVAMRRQDRSWSGRGFLGVFHHSDGSAG